MTRAIFMGCGVHPTSAVFGPGLASIRGPRETQLRHSLQGGSEPLSVIPAGGSRFVKGEMAYAKERGRPVCRPRSRKISEGGR